MLIEQKNIIPKSDSGKNDPFDRNFAMQKFVAAIKALEDVIDRETSLLERRINPDFSDINARKARNLHILNRTMVELSKHLDENLNLEIENLLKMLKVKLERNSHILKIHLEAVGGLVNMLRSAFEAQETDGTYNPFLLNTGQF
ncbi:MAG: hypothetical protein JSC188_000066 [Candidatus Tokpelaia sp. JSC188]|nr:MAG: hypothetical protein JSC188_000066 [Candidatus Tokpelaia sp. JSC188]